MKKLVTLLLTVIMLAMMLPLGSTVLAEEAPTRIVWFWREGGDPELPPDGYIANKVLEDLNIEYVHVTSVGMTPEEKLTMLLASGEVPDIIDSYNEKTTELINYGVIIPLDEYLTEDRIGNMMNNMYQWDTALEIMRREDGQVWAIPATFASVSGPTPYIRYDWLETLGLEVPTTLDELREVLIAFTKNDPDGNGKDDTWGTSYGGLYSGINTNMGASWNRWYVAEDGTAEWGLMNDRVIAYLQWMQDLIADGGCNPEILDPNELGDGHGNAIKSGQLGFSFGYNSPADTTLQELQKLYPEAEWGPMLPPKGIYDVGYLPIDAILRQEYVISKDALEAGKIDKIFELMDYMCNDGGDTVNIDFDAPYWPVSYGERGVNWDLTEDGLFDYNGRYIEAIRLNNEGKGWTNGQARRFRTKAMQAAYDMGLTEEQKADKAFIDAMPLLLNSPVEVGAQIITEGVEIPADVVLLERNMDLLWASFGDKAMLGEVDITEGIEQLRQDALGYGYEEAKETMTEIYRSLGKLPE